MISLFFIDNIYKKQFHSWDKFFLVKWDFNNKKKWLAIFIFTNEAAWSPCAAMCKQFNPCLFFKATSAPFSTNKVIIFRLPRKAARCNGVNPSSVFSFVHSLSRRWWSGMLFESLSFRAFQIFYYRKKLGFLIYEIVKVTCYFCLIVQSCYMKNYAKVKKSIVHWY